MFFKKNTFNNQNLLFGFTLVIYVIFNCDRLDLPYFWDELACYFRSSHYIYHHQLSLFPSAVPSDISFDHPLLIQNTIALMMLVFNNSPLVVHLFFLCVSILFVVFMYKVARKFNLNNFSVFAVFLIATQPIFIAQNMLFQLEMTFSFLCFLSVYFYSIKHYNRYILFACLNMLVKESAIVIPFSLLMYELIIKFNTKNKFQFKQLVSLIPLVVFIVFIVLTKFEKGYFLSPINSGKTSFYFEVFKQRLNYCLHFIFISQGRIYFSVLFLGIIIYILFVKKEKSKFRQLIFLPFNFQSIVFIFLFIIFSAINNPLERYLLVVIPFIYFIFFQLLTISGINKKLKPVILMVLFIPSFLNIYSKNRFTDSDLSYVSHINSMIQLKDYLYQNNLTNKTIKADWPIIFSLQNNEFGLMKEKHNSIYLMNEVVNNQVDLFIFTFPGNLEEKQVPDSLKLLKNIEVNYAKCQVWIKK